MTVSFLMLQNKYKINIRLILTTLNTIMMINKVNLDCAIKLYRKRIIT